MSEPRNDILTEIRDAIAGAQGPELLRNDLLIDIIQLRGGTVSNPNDRNMLLKDIFKYIHLTELG